MCTYNAINSHTDHFEIQKRDSEELLNLSVMLGNYLQKTTSADDISDAFFLAL